MMTLIKIVELLSGRRAKVITTPDNLEFTQIGSGLLVASKPPRGSKLIMGRYGSNIANSIAMSMLLPADVMDELNEGDACLFSMDGENVVQLLFVRADGNIELGGDLYSAVGFEPLDIGLQQFVVQLNSSLSIAGGPPVTLNITPSKIDDVKLGD